MDALPSIPEQLSSPRHRVGTSISHADNAATQRLPDGRIILVSKGSRKTKRSTKGNRCDLSAFEHYLRDLPDMKRVSELFFALRGPAPRIAEQVLETLFEKAKLEVDALYRPLELCFMPEENLIIHKHLREGMFDLTVQRRLPRLWQVYAYIPEGDRASKKFVWYQDAKELSEAIAKHKVSLCRALVAHAVRMSDPDVPLSYNDLSNPQT